MEVSLLHDASLRIERIAGDSELIAFRLALEAMKPPDGVEVQASWIWPVDFLPVLATQRAETLRLLQDCAGTLREHCVHFQGREQAAIACARRRPIGEFVAFTMDGNDRCAVMTNTRRTLHVHAGHIGEPGEWEQKTVPSPFELLTELRQKFDFTQPARPWILLGQECATLVPELADQFHAEKMIIPAHCGGAIRTIEMLMGDHYVERSLTLAKSSPLPGDPARSDEERLRAIVRDLMDEVSREAFRLGFDTDDLVCYRMIVVRNPDSQRLVFFTERDGNVIRKALELCGVERGQTNELSHVGTERPYIGEVKVFAIIETLKPILPPTSTSITIDGGDTPTPRVVVGPGKMLACLCEIDVPAGWRAEWEPCGDVVMTRV